MKSPPVLDCTEIHALRHVLGIYGILWILHILLIWECMGISQTFLLTFKCPLSPVFGSHCDPFAFQGQVGISGDIIPTFELVEANGKLCGVYFFTTKSSKILTDIKSSPLISTCVMIWWIVRRFVSYLRHKSQVEMISGHPHLSPLIPTCVVFCESWAGLWCIHVIKSQVEMISGHPHIRP